MRGAAACGGGGHGVRGVPHPWRRGGREGVIWWVGFVGGSVVVFVGVVAVEGGGYRCL